MNELTDKIIKDSLKTKNPEVYLRDNVNITRAEARKAISHYRSKKKRRFIDYGLAAIIFGVCGGIMYHSSKEREQAFMSDESVEDIILRHAHIDKVVNPEGSGNLYLIGQKHAESNFGGIRTNKNVIGIQCDNLSLLRDMVSAGHFELLIGEGSGKKELIPKSDAKDKKYGKLILNDRKEAKIFFENNIGAVAYEALKKFWPDKLRVFGADTSKIDEKRDYIRKKMSERLNLYIAGLRRDRGNPRSVDVGEAAKYDPVLLDLVKEDSKYNDEVSRIYLKKGIETADSLGYKNLGIILGSRHLRLIMEEYKGKRRLYVIRPKSMKTKITDLPLDDFEGFKKFYGF